jgi:GLPGLI family protein
MHRFIKVTYVLCLLLYNSIFLPDTSGEIIYGIIPNNISNEKKADKKEFFEVFDYLNESILNLNFSLKFNQNESIFGLEKQMESDINKMSVSYAENIATKGQYYYNIEKNELLREAKSYSKYTLVKSIPSEIKWTITKESKIISGYLCYKATRIKTKTNNFKQNNFLVEAWFCPEIPLSFGPTEYNRLPGLILELRAPLFTFFAKKINLNSKKQNIIPLKSKNIISEEDDIKNFQGLINKN